MMDALIKKPIKFLLSLTLSSMACFAETSGELLRGEKREPWYQVEVIIFSQQDLFEGELPRTDINLNFPDNWLYLVDPHKRVSEEEPQQASSKSPAIAESVLDVTIEPNELPQRQTEQPYRLLDKDLQQLGPDHYSLRRAPGYRVLYHQAWRQPGLNFKNAPWIIIQGGEQYDQHFELEGSLRFVKSRHLHIQANLWKTAFEPISRTQQLAAQLEKRRKKSNKTANLDENENSELAAEVTWPELPLAPQEPEPEATESNLQIKLQGSSELEPGESVTMGPESTEQLLENLPVKQYQVTTITKLKQSLKLSMRDMGYLDHPNMGLLVLVSKYERPDDT